MLQKFKIFFLLSAVIIIGLNFFLSCENPLSSDLGRKVDVVPPAVIVHSPVAGGFIRGVALFEGRATAYRSLKRVEYKIFANDATGQALVDWREVRYVNTNNSKERKWFLDLDTSHLNRGNDGSIKMQFRAIDDSQKGETVEFVYIVKNRPSVISMTTPAEDLTNPNTTPRLVYGTDIRGQITDRKGLKPGFPQIKIWPDELGYEPDPNDSYRFNDPSDVNWGWASLFLPGVGNAEIGFDELEGIPAGGWLPQGSYADRTKMSPVRVSQFAFRLDKFTVVVDDDNPDIRRIVYETDSGGNRSVHMDPGKLYYFRIRTSDTNTYTEEEEKKEVGKFQLPVGPDHPLFDDNLIGYFPPVNYGEANENQFRKRPDAAKLTLISDAVPPEILLDNSDKESEAGWDTKPHIYINEPTVKKIAAEDPVNPAGTLFRLRIRGQHTDGISMAVLRYTHDATGREGYLRWDDDHPDSQGYVSTVSELDKAKEGHRGVYVDPLDRSKGTIFTFTANAENQKDIVTGQPIFLTSSGPYILEATVTSGNNSINSAKYVVYMDGVGPDVSIQEIVGASSHVEQISVADQDALDVLAKDAGGVINGSSYTVNNNIQVVVNRFDDSGIMQNIDGDSANPNDPDPITPAPARPKADVLGLAMAKWIVEIADDNDDDNSLYFTKAGTTYQKLLAYRKTPTAANLKFFNDITDSTVSPAMSGWVNLPKNAGKPADQRNNFKFNTNHVNFNNKYLWVYVISQDTVQNLGFVMQKIYVDQDSDMPELNVEALTDKNGAGTTITGTNYNTALNVVVANDRTLSGNIVPGSNFKNNVLEENQPIDLSFSDNDGINLGSVNDAQRGVTITISDLNGLKNAAGADLVEAFTGAEIRQILRDGNKNNWTGVISQQQMATTLYRNLSPAPNPRPVHLYDGIYKIEITYRDDVNEKVAITLADRPGMTALQPGDTPASVAGAPQIYYFAVNAEAERPQIFVDSVEENQMQSDLPVTVSGRVRSRLKVQRLWITFTPDIITPSADYNSSKTEEITTLYTTAAHTTTIPNLLNHELKDADGYYIYFWKRDNVVFQPTNNNYGSDQDNRRVSLEAYDRLGNRNAYTRTVLVDGTPPTVNVAFNYGRTGSVNGKVPFTVTATDNNKLAEFPSNRPNDPFSGVKWWVLPAASAAPGWDTPFPTGLAGTGGQFYTSQEGNGGRFTGYINTTTLNDNAEYRLYVIAQDTAGNRKGVPPDSVVTPFHIDQSTDLPTFDTTNLKPPLGTIMGDANISISGGLASDDDGFDRTNREKLPLTSAIGGTGYVQIRFPATWEPDGTPRTWGSWISVYGTLNPEGAIRFDFKVDDLPNGKNNAIFNGYFTFDGAKHYQIKITDEDVAGPNDRPPGKNPDNAAPFLPSVSRIFPIPGGLTDTYNFVLDNKPPEIFFDKYDPSSGPSVHPNYNPIRPAYSYFYKVEGGVATGLAADLKGHVEENNFETLTIIWDDARQLLKNKDDTSTLTNGVRSYRWDINEQDPRATAIKARFEEKFKSVGEGLHSITLEATDTAGNNTRVGWMFYKDTQGPNILVTGIRRVINHTPSIPGAGAFPANWPSDWPYGNEWKTDTTWDTLRTPSFGLADWPSEYAFFTGATVADKAAKVIAALNAENGKDIAPTGREVSVISGDMGQVFIKGSFSDDISDIWADPNVPPVFYYRFNGTGRNAAPSVHSGPPIWTPANCNEMGTGNSKTAEWQIPIPDTLPDGEHTFDIKMADKAGNWADMYRLRFIVDRTDPKLLGYNAGGTDVDPNPNPVVGAAPSFSVAGGGAEDKPLPEDAQRVFSAAGATGGEITVFSLKGFVRDNNLSELNIVITSEGANPYRVESTLKDIEVWATGGAIVTSNDPDVTGGRLVLTRSATPSYQWQWTLNVLEKDIYALRNQAGSTDATRRYITITAIDKAKRRDGPLRWNFYLDSKEPVIEYTNLEKGPNFTVNGGAADAITLQGIASDDTKIRDVKYSLAKWDYTAGDWRWATSAGFTLPAPPDTADWASMLDPNYGANNATSMVNWTLNNAKLNASQKYPQNVFNDEGMYRLDLYVTDWSLGILPKISGNPYNTYRSGETAFADVGGVSGRKFFIDRFDPIVSDKSSDKNYYRNDNAIFEFTVSDANTVKVDEITVKIKKTDGTYIEIPAGAVTSSPAWPGRWVPPTVTPPTPGTWAFDVTVDLRPFMGQGNLNLDFGNYTLEISVKDGADKETVVTKAFTLDNEKPVLTIVSPPGGDDAVTGRVVIRGNTTENSNLIKKVAFYVANSGNSFGAPPAYTGIADTDFANGWHFYQDPTNRHQINYTNPPPATGGGTLIQIDPGTFTWAIRIPNARNFNVSAERNTYVQWTTKALTGDTANVTYNGMTIPTGEDVGKLTLYIVAEDEAGNVIQVPKFYWLYPEGDRPTASFSNPDDKKIEAERLMNGRIRVAGMARDNERVKYVWFRVLRTNADGSIGTPYTNFKATSIYSWNTETWEIATPAELTAGVNVIDNRTPTTLYDEAQNNLGDGWYRANGGGSPNVSWYTYINMEGELEPQGGEGANKIAIEVRAEDTTRRDDNDEWVAVSVKGMVSRNKSADRPPPIPPTTADKGGIGNTVTALVVQGAPVFENEEVKTGRSSEGSESDWGSIVTKSLSKRASYRIVVKDDSGVGAIRWTRTEWNGTIFEPKTTINLLDSGNAYNTTTVGPATYGGHLARMDTGTYDLDTNPGIAVKAEPNPSRLKKAGDALVNGRTYLIWVAGGGYTTDITDNAQYMTFTASGNHSLTGTAQLIERGTLVKQSDGSLLWVDDGNYEWLVTVDVNTKLLDNRRYDPDNHPNGNALIENPNASYLYPLTLSATDISKATPLQASNTSYLPIDNKPPKGSYTINTRPAGQAATIGGEAGDDGPVNGISKVVIWFSRDRVYTGTNGISWHENAIYNVHKTPSSGEKLAAVTDWKPGEPITATTIGVGGVLTQLPITLPFIPTKDDTTPSTPGWSTSGAYAIVIDRNDPSGVQTQWGQKMPMGLSTGGMGKIWYAEINSYGITSGPVYIHYVVYDTADNASYFKERLVIMNDAPQIARIKLGTDIRDNNTLRSGANVSLATAGLPDNNATIPLNIIRNAVPPPVTGTTTTDVQKGITDYISNIRTAETGAIRQVDFNARNRLLALRVETTGEPGANKTRSFRFEYVSGAKRMVNTNTADADKLTGIKAGRVYVIDDPGNARWGAVGAPEVSSYNRGFAFMASLDGIDEDTKLPRGELNAATGSVWELNSTYYNTAGNRVNVPSALTLADAEYVAQSPVPENVNYAMNAEFVYKQNAFGTGTRPTTGSVTTIFDYNPAVNTNQPNTDPSTGNSLFILKIFDDEESDVFADFALLSFRVNNNDVTRPSSQLYDLNPMTEGQARQQSVQRSLAPMGIGLNRTRGGLWNTDTTARTVAKPGHIEPRKATSLTSAQMGGAGTLAGNTVAQPYANPLAFYNVDTVSGRVILRGYAEDDQRVNQIDLIFTDTGTPANNRTVTILDRSVASPNTPPKADGGTAASFIPATTGLLKVAANTAANPTTDRVYYTDDIDLYRHRVEWAYIWDTEALPANMVVGAANVRAVVYNENSVAADPGSAVKASVNTAAPTSTTPQPGTLNNYNSIPINLRPYITGFMRNQNQFFHNTRSRQGWYAFSRSNTAADGETVVVRGYNIGRANPALNTTITLQGAANLTAAAATAAQVTSHALPAPNEAFRYRAFTVTNTATPGPVTLTVGTFQAVNNYTNGNDRPRLNAAGTAVDNNGRFWVQPWNTEYSPGAAGSNLWDDFTSVHIWHSNNVQTGADQGAFPTRKENSNFEYPAMSMDPSNGALYASHNEGGGGTVGANSGTTMISNNYSSWATSGSGNQVARADVTSYASFVDPIYYSDIYFPPSGNANPVAAGTANATAFASYSIYGRSGNYELWGTLGGVYVSGPGGTNAHLSNGMNQNNQYHAESTYYNASSNSATVASPPTTDQFYNTHIVTTTISGNTHIHVSYYDSKDGSLKYRYNLRGSQNDTLSNNNPANISARDTGSAGVNGVHNQNAQAISKQWTNLDGGYDGDDTAATNFVNDNVRNLAGAGSTAITANARVVNQGTRPAAAANRIDAGEHNSIALTSQGYPVVAYFDTTNQKLKLAVSRRVAPVLAADWRIRDNVIPTGNLSHYATGEFVSIAIDTKAGTNQNRIHMAALNSTSKNLVYITGIVNPTSDGDGLLTGVTVQVVDNVGSVGRWCDISMDSDGNPWIAYQDESYRGSMDGVRMAFRSTTYTKAMADIYGDSISGWESMNVPARYRVQDARINIANFPARNTDPATNAAGNNRFWKAAVAYPSPDFFRIAYYVK